MSLKFEINLNVLSDKLEHLSHSIEKDIMDELFITGLMIESSYKIASPVDTGRLRSSINTQKIDKTVFIGTNVIYARVIELGIDDAVSVDAHIRTITKAFGKEIRPKEIRVQTHVRSMKRKGNNALKTSFEKETAGLPERLAKLIK